MSEMPKVRPEAMDQATSLLFSSLDELYEDLSELERVSSKKSDVRYSQIKSYIAKGGRELTVVQLELILDKVRRKLVGEPLLSLGGDTLEAIYVYEVCQPEGTVRPEDTLTTAFYFIELVFEVNSVMFLAIGYTGVYIASNRQEAANMDPMILTELGVDDLVELEKVIKGRKILPVSDEDIDEKPDHSPSAA